VPVWAAVSYEGAARALVRTLKFGGAVRLVDAMAAQMAANAPPGLLDDAALVAVPTHPHRLRTRGFDHADGLARVLHRRLDAAFLVGWLERVDAGARQVGAGRAGRRARGRMVVRARRGVPPVVALVDDVHTTGATLDACARALREAGAERVVAITYTRTLP
jgi:predicted amidophosphoribosyltransferase